MILYLGNQGYDCNFDSSLCSTFSTNSSSKSFSWLRHQGSPDSVGTGPRNDHTTNSNKGSYMYVDASWPAKVNDSAWLLQSMITNTNGFCMSFWYHMFGPHVGTLNLWLQVIIKIKINSILYYFLSKICQVFHMTICKGDAVEWFC